MLDPRAPSFVPVSGSTKPPYRNPYYDDDSDLEPSSSPTPFELFRQDWKSARAYKSRRRRDSEAWDPTQRVRFSTHPDSHEHPQDDDEGDYKGQGKGKGKEPYKPSNDNYQPPPSSKDELSKRYGISNNWDKTAQSRDPAPGSKVPSESDKTKTATTPLASSTDRHNHDDYSRPSSSCQPTTSDNYPRPYSYRNSRSNSQYYRYPRRRYQYSSTPMAHSYPMTSYYDYTQLRAGAGPGTFSTEIPTVRQLQTEFLDMLTAWRNYSHFMNQRIYQQGVRLGLYPQGDEYGYKGSTTERRSYGGVATGEEYEGVYEGYIDANEVFHPAPRN